MFSWRHTSRNLTWDGKLRSEKFMVAFCAFSFKLKMPIALFPSSRSFTQTSILSFSVTFLADFPNASWSKASTSSLVNKFKVKSSSWLISHSINKSAENKHHKLIWVYCSSGVNRVLCKLGPQPTFPITNMSGSLKWPGCALGAGLSWLKPMEDRLPHESLISPVVLQLLPPTSAPQFQTSPIPY